ncbi:MAG: ABC transporter substrate-binding protein [Ottowia sp.]|uniref:ABC transporter substrate-binding protein n=1 Tax=Ottowia sp. TaxID=1898956 RepID=UPI003C77D91F
MTSSTSILRRHFMLGAATSTLGLPAMAQNKDKVSLLYLPVTDYAPFFVAKEKGYFDDFNINVELLPKDATAETVPMVAGGLVTAGGASWSAGVFNAAAAGSGVVVVADLARVPTKGRSSVHFMLSPAMAQAGTTVSSLKGKRVGVLGAGAFTEYFAAQVLKAGGLGLPDVQVIHLTVPTFGQAFANGAIDAGVVFEPFATMFEQKNIAKLLPGDYARGTEVGFILVNADFLKAKQDVVVRMLAGYLRAVRHLQDGGWEDAATQALMLKYMKIDASVLNRIGVPTIDRSGAIDLTSVRAQEAFFRQAGKLSYRKPLDWAALYPGEVAAKAAALLDKR